MTSNDRPTGNAPSPSTSSIEPLVRSTRTTGLPPGLAQRAIALQTADRVTSRPQSTARSRVAAWSWRLPRFVPIAASLGLLAVIR